MKQILFIFILFIMFSSCSFANDSKEVEKFFYRYVNAANSYDSNYFDFYTSNAKIIRVIENPDGTKESVNIPLERYKKEAKASKKIMKLRKYKNNYYNVRIIPYGEDYKVIALRMPSTSDYKVPAYFVIGKDSCGHWKIKEESMNTKVRTFLTSN